MSRIDRLYNPIHSRDQSSRFLILYGSGLEDFYLSPENKEITFEKALVQTLKSEGFMRSLFISPHIRSGDKFQSEHADGFFFGTA